MADLVSTPVDFLDLGSRAAVDKVLQRLVAAGQLRRIDRGLYDTPRLNSLTKQPAVADYREIIDALGRRDQLRMLVDGMTVANDLGLTTAVPARAVIHTDTRRRTIHLDNLTIEFKQTAPSKLYWSGRPAMRIVQALQWLKDTLPADRDRITAQLSALLADRRHGRALRDDLCADCPRCPHGCRTSSENCSAPTPIVPPLQLVVGVHAPSPRSGRARGPRRYESR
jgi:hypothetical protein